MEPHWIMGKSPGIASRRIRALLLNLLPGHLSTRTISYRRFSPVARQISCSGWTLIASSYQTPAGA